MERISGVRREPVLMAPGLVLWCDAFGITLAVQAGSIEVFLRGVPRRSVVVEPPTGVVDGRAFDDVEGSRCQEGLFLNMPRLVQPGADGNFTPLHTHSTAKSFAASIALQRELAYLEPELQAGRKIPIGELLKADMLHFRRQLDETILGRDHMEMHLIYAMPWIVTSPWPALTAAQINTQVEFDRTLRTVAHAHSFRGKCVFCISGLNIDVSPQPGELFPTTKFVPWAAFLRDQSGEKRIMEQAELVELLREQSRENPDQIELDSAIRDMSEAESVEIKTPAAE